MAEIPTFQQRVKIDRNGDDELTPDEADAFAVDQADRILRNLELTADGAPVDLEMVSAIGGLGEGQGGLALLRLDVSYEGRLLEGVRRLEFADRNDPKRRGWREVTAFANCGATIGSSTVPQDSLSAALLLYPEDRIDDPPNVREAEVVLGPETEERCPDAASPTAPVPSPGPTEGFAGLVAREDLSPFTVLVAVLLAMGFGAVHALFPGHGKTVTAAYLAGSSAGVRHAVRSGVAVSLMHTASVLVLGFVTAAASAAFAPETVYPWLTVIAGAVVLVLGVAMLMARTRAREASHGHDHDHEHDEPLGPARLGALAMAGGLLPSPTAVLVLTAAIALDRLVFGLVLVAAFSVGLAAALAAIGVAAIRVRAFAGDRFRWVASAIPLVSAGAVVAAGTYLVTTGVLKL